MMKTALLAAVTTAAFATPSFAGGLADAITEREPVIIAETSRNAMPGWVLPTMALVLLGAAVAGGGGGGDSSPTPETRTAPVIDVKNDL